MRDVFIGLKAIAIVAIMLFKVMIMLSSPVIMIIAYATGNNFIAVLAFILFLYVLFTGNDRRGR